LVSVSRDLFLRTGGLLVGLLAVTSAAARAGAVTLAAHQVLWQVWITVTLLMDGFAIAAQAMVGTALGTGDVAEARATARATGAWGIGGGIAVAAALLLLHDLVPRLLTNEPDVLAAVASAWWLAVGGHVLNGWLFVLDGVFMGAGDFAYLRTWTLVAAVAGGGLAQLSTSLFDWGLLGLWIAIELMMIVRLLALLVRLRGQAWARVGSVLPR
ncbi:MAG: MATE family efflux transporter, partial [Nitriliruptorales bacterium]